MGSVAGDRPTTPAELTAAAVGSFDGASDERLRTIMQALVRHLHAFASEVELTQDEWVRAIGILTATATSPTTGVRSSSSGRTRSALSMLVDALANPAPTAPPSPRCSAPSTCRARPSASTARAWSASRPAPRPGCTAACSIDGSPVAGAELDVWQNGDDQLYAVQRPEAPEDHLRGRFRTRDDGSYAFLAVRPVPYTIPHDGPVGQMLAATGRHPWRPAHIHMIVRAPGYRTVATHIFDSGERVPRLRRRLRGQAIAAARVRAAGAGRPRPAEWRRGRLLRGRERLRARGRHRSRRARRPGPHCVKPSERGRHGRVRR